MRISTGCRPRAPPRADPRLHRRLLRALSRDEGVLDVAAALEPAEKGLEVILRAAAVRRRESWRCFVQRENLGAMRPELLQHRLDLLGRPARTAIQPVVDRLDAEGFVRERVGGVDETGEIPIV